MLTVGVVPALVNYNLRADPLLHSISVAKCRAIVFSAELAGVSAAFPYINYRLLCPVVWIIRPFYNYIRYRIRPHSKYDCWITLFYQIQTQT